MANLEENDETWPTGVHALASSEEASAATFNVPLQHLTNRTAYLKARLSEAIPYVSVADFGAVGDGSTNDTAAIQAAFTAAEAGTSILFQPGKTYKITSVITAATGVHVVGYGATLKAGSSIQNVGMLKFANQIGRAHV